VGDVGAGRGTEAVELGCSVPCSVDVTHGRRHYKVVHWFDMAAAGGGFEDGDRQVGGTGGAGYGDEGGFDRRSAEGSEGEQDSR